MGPVQVYAIGPAKAVVNQSRGMGSMGFRLKEGHTPYLVVAPLEDTGMVRAVFSTRLGGTSHPPYDSLNLGLRAGDRQEDVMANRVLLLEALGLVEYPTVVPAQVHGREVYVVTEKDKIRHDWQEGGKVAEADAVITDVAGIILATQYADCVPVFLLDPVRRVIGLAHAGWRGTVLKTAAHTVSRMAEIYGTNPSDVIAAIGPSIGPCCYEVDRAVMEPFAANFSQWGEMAVPIGPEHWLLDLWEANRRVLVEAGLNDKHIFQAGLCTSCRSDLFFSYRRDHGQTGRMAALLMLK